MNRSRRKPHGPAALAILIVAMATMAAIALAPYVGAFIAAQEIEASRAALSKLGRLAGRVSQVEDRSARIQSSNTHLKLLLSAETTGIAGAKLHRFLLDRLTQHKGLATTLLVQQPEADGDLMRISTSLTARIDITGLRDLLHDLETGIPLLFVTNLSVQSLEAEARRNAAQMLDVRMRVSGYLSKNAALQ
ncbi:MAG: type II secretion system protein GspM [Methyloligellaceae bacterium]